MNGAINYLNVVSGDIHSARAEVLDFKVAEDKVMISAIDLPASLIGHVDAVNREILKNQVSSGSPCLDWSIPSYHWIGVPNRHAFPGISGDFNIFPRCAGGVVLHKVQSFCPSPTTDVKRIPGT